MCIRDRGVHVIIALHMIDIVRKRGDRIDTEKLPRDLGCQVLEISALKGTGIRELVDAVVKTATSEDARAPRAVHFLSLIHIFTPILMLVPPKSTANVQGSEKLLVHTYATHPLESTQKRIHTHPFPRHAELLV